ncbi:MAG: agmatine deiminase family protein [Planctomycetales bacterium]|nr:agmatine deiminase family protein [Planctomycetales bacterium]
MSAPLPSPTPRQMGYRMPAEWEPHAATWLSFPHKEASWPGRLEAAQRTFAAMVAALATSETVHVNVNDEAMEAAARRLFDEARVDGDVRFHRFPTNDAWCRDHGAIFLVRGPASETTRGALATDWRYNAWGEKYPPYDLDNDIPRRMAEHLAVPRIALDMVLEGGSIDVDGCGLLLTSRACLLNPNRNPQLSEDDIELRLREMLGVEKILWLGEGIVGDDTDGHIDDITRFVAPGKVVTAVEDDPQDDNFRPLRENLALLAGMTDLDDKPLEVVTLPMPRPVVWEGQRLPASYANFYIGNRVVLTPTYGCPADDKACQTLQTLFPERAVVGIDCTTMVWGLGAFHCLTQQIPLA